MANTWKNNDSLYLKYGTALQTAQTAGEFRTNAEMRELWINLDLTTLTSSAAIIADTTFFPTTMRIAEIVVMTHTAATSSGSATLDIGLQKTDRSTEIDYNGLVAAMPKTSIDLAGETNTLHAGDTYAGALMGTATTDVGYLTANYNTAAFTAGVVRVRVRYYGYGTISN